MIVYNITTKVHISISNAWLQWQQQEHIPEIMASGFFISCGLCRLLEQDDSEGNTYATQFLADTEEHYRLYITECAALMREKALKKWGDKTISFQSLLEVIQ